jgi:hypothetical protein
LKQNGIVEFFKDEKENGKNWWYFRI